MDVAWIGRALVISLLLALTACGGKESPPSAAHGHEGPVVFIGDSITAYWPLPADAVDTGVPGQTTDQMLARFNDEVMALHPRIVVILGGTNDLRHLNSPTIDNIARMATIASAAGATVVIGTIPPINDWNVGMPLDATAGNQAVHTWNRDLKNLAGAYGYKLADYYPVMVLADDTQNPALFNSDRLHPNDAGYGVMWDVVSPLIH